MFPNRIFASACLLVLSLSHLGNGFNHRTEFSPRNANLHRYDPNWKSLDARPLPSWFDEGKIGVFLHWGVFSVPSLLNEWFWLAWESKNPAALAYMKANYKPKFTYADFAPSFTAELYDPDYWTELFEAAGAKYVVLTTKHHEGYCNWNTSYCFNWNSLDVGPKRDLVGDLAKAVRKRGNMKFGVYHSMFEWFNPLFMEDQAAHFKTNRYVGTKPIPCLHELVNKYHPDLIWSDGDWMANYTYWTATDFLAWLYNDSPVKDTVVVNDRWGMDARCKHGGFLNCNDKYNPGTLQKRKWENALSIDTQSWGYRRSIQTSQLMTIEEILHSLASTVSCGGNFLLNIGPRSDGTIDPLMESRLRHMGSWLKINGEAIYGSVPWKFQNDTMTSNVWYTMQNSSKTVYALVLDWPANNTLTLKSPMANKGKTTIGLLGYSDALQYSVIPTGGITVQFPSQAFAYLRYVWVLKLSSLLNSCDDS